jgi:two-component system sensor histidine kinase/response regulator
MGPCGERVSQAIDVEFLLNNCVGKPELAARLLAMFNERLDATVEEIERSILRRDAECLMLAAHTLKGTAGILGIEGVSGGAQALESRGRSGELDGARDAVSELKREIDRFRAFLATRPLVLRS